MKKSMIFVLITALLVLSTAFATYEITGVKPTPPTAEVQGGVQTVLGAAQWIGFIVGIAMIIWVGVKYLTAGAGKKAEVKSTMIPILVGAALVALAPTIAQWVFGMFAGDTPTTTTTQSSTATQVQKPTPKRPPTGGNIAIEQ